MPNPDDEEERNTVLVLLRTVLPDWDPIQEIKDAEEAERKWIEEHAEQRHQDRKRVGDFDDDIPF